MNHVTCGVGEDGVVAYDEQFSGQLRALYEDREGWLYACENDGSFDPGSSPWIVTTRHAVAVSSVEHIPDAYAAILREIDMGTVRVKRYEDKTEAQKRDIIEMMARLILKNGYLDLDTPKAHFMEQYFPEAWQIAGRK